MLSSRPTIKELANWYGISHYLMIQMLTDGGIVPKKGKKGNRSRLLPMDVHMLMAKYGEPLKINVADTR